MTDKKILFISDLHFKVNNNDVTDVFIEKCLQVLTELKDKYGSSLICVMGGDLLDTHERIHQTPYNKMIKFVDNISQKVETIILVGNHDYENNQQFLTDKHWMNPLKKWNNVTIVDKVLFKYNLVFVPYVPVGRFMEALDTLTYDWRDAVCIFAHQEFKGCKLGVGKSENGDKWPLHYPLVISGHIHKAHKPQENIIYPGSVLQHSFGEQDNDTGLFFIDFEIKDFTTIPVNVPKMTTITTTCQDFENTVKHMTVKPLERVRLICVGEDENFKRIKKTNLYNNLPTNIQVNFRTQKEEIEETIHDNDIFDTFDSLLGNCLKENDLGDVFNMILHKNEFLELVEKFA